MNMNANNVIESYVTEVALKLPRKQRNDVAFELRALLNEGLQDKADESGREADAAMAIEFLRAFGRPEEVAARYRPSLTIIDPADGRKFLKWSIIGLVIIWSTGLLESFGQPVHSSEDFMRALAHWWLGVVIPSLWWPGVLVTWFGVSAWAGQRQPQTSQWKPRAGDHSSVNRGAMTMAVVAMMCGLYVLMNPHWVLDFFWNGHAAPAAYDALTYTDTFLQRQAPWLFGSIVLYILLSASVTVIGRWSIITRRIETGMSLAGCVVMVWVALDGPAMKSQFSDGTFRSLLFLIALIIFTSLGIKLYRNVRPAPNQQAPV